MSFSLICLGDVMLGENINHINRGIRSKFTKDFSKLIGPKVKKELTKDIDCIFYNFEYSLVNGIEHKSIKYSDAIYVSEIESLNLFDKNFLKVVNIANNHFSQHGSEIASNTISHLKKNKFIVVGETNKPINIRNDQTQIFFWGVSLVKDSEFCHKYFFSTYDKLLNDLVIHKKSIHEKWIISLHWGDEYITHPSEKQIQLSQQLIDAGFDLVIGHHPHVIQPTSLYKNKPILYSLGNFIFDQNFSNKTQTGLAVKIKLSSNGTEIVDTYYTFQKKYKVQNLKKVKIGRDIIRKAKFYKIRLFMNNKLYRVLMKLELIFNYNEVSPTTKKYYRDKFLKFFQ